MTPVRLALGTAQLGMPYGVANASGRPAPEAARAILQAALDVGIAYVDTAAAYGDAEVLVGRVLRTARGRDRVAVGTKLPALPGGLAPAALARAVDAAIEASRQRLSLDVIDDVLVHAGANLREYGRSLVEALAGHVEAGRVRRAGISVYDRHDVDLALTFPALVTAQFPFSVLDRRLVDDGTVDRLRAAGYLTFARSVFLQGLLLQPPDRAESLVPGAGPWVTAFARLCQEHGVTHVTAAVGYAGARSGADRLVVGVDSPGQLREIVAASRTALPEAALAGLDAALGQVPAGLLDPRAWRGAAS
jgi:aryl-alcohol dehydrogenase-like predicted oxidoreductase